MQKTYLLLIISLSWILAGCSQKIVYQVDLNQIDQDRLKVTVEIPRLDQDTLTFGFPAVIPGHYNMVNYGRFVDSLTATHADGDPIPIEQIGNNQWTVASGRQAICIDYLMNDSWDAEVEEIVYPWAATNFEAGEKFILNNGGVFGYIKEYINLPIQIKIRIPENLMASTSLPLKSTDGNLLTYQSADYHELVDCPILVAREDITHFSLGEAEITVACSNEANVAVSQYLAQEINKHLSAVLQFIDSDLPVSQYTYLVNMQDFSDFKEPIYHAPITFEILGKIVETHGIPILGALEHNTSSFHHYAYLGKKESLMDLMDVSIIHEFLHIYTPLHLHSNLTGNFDYSNPEITQHIWMYEGITEYFSGLVKLQGGMVTLHEYLLNIMREKIREGKQFPSDMKWTELSRNIYKKPFKDHFGQFYRQGAVNAWMLDIEIIRLTDGEKNLKSVMMELVNEYGKDRSFPEEELFEIFTRKVHPDLREFFSRHIEDTLPINISGQLEKIGIIYEPSVPCRMPVSILENGHGVKDVIELFRYYTINEVEENSIFKPGDKIRSIDFGRNCLKPFKQENGLFIDEGASATLPVYRNREWIELTLTPEWKEGTYRNRLYEIPDKTPEQERFFQAWMR